MLCTIITLQGCNSEEDGLFGFDLHSDGNGQRFVLLTLLSSDFLSSSKLCNQAQTLPWFRHLNAAIRENESDNALDSNGSVLGSFPPKPSSYSCIQMNGKEVFRFAVRCVPQSIEYALEKAGLPASSIDWLILHQVRRNYL